MPSWPGPAPDAGLEGEPAAPEATALPADYVAVPARGREAEEPLSPAGQEAMDEAEGEGEQQLIGVLARYDIEPPVIGDEYGAGTPLEIAWPERKVGVSTSELAARERAARAQAGGEPAVGEVVRVGPRGGPAPEDDATGAEG